ncbi:MAG: AbgT family transporter [Bacteroidales bacterium]|nr:AbgT family transporter [Bacteroidales bacterium]MCF8326757.1 AbgT family transporter [Bacteroidales bacterium]
MEKQEIKKKTLFTKVLDGIEVVGNRLPHPATIFALLALFVIIVSFLGYLFNVQATHPVSGEIIEAQNLLSADGFRWMYSNILDNFLKFPPLGYVLVVMIGIGVAEGSGLFTLMIRALVLKSPPRLITASIVTAGIISHLASEAGYVVLIPLGALVFHALGRHPMAGLAAAFVGVSGGFGSNFFIGSIDPILAGISETAAQIIIPDISVNPAVNYYFMFLSSFLVIIVGTWVTEKIVEPRLGEYKGSAERIPIERLTPLESKGLKRAGIGVLITIALLAFSVIPENGILRNPETGGILKSPFFDGIIIGILILFFIPGMIYGITVGTIKNDKDVVKHITKSMGGMAGYIVLVFFAAQFVYFFNYSNLGIIFAIKGAKTLTDIGLTGIPLIVGFVFLSALINMFMGSASAKWAIMAPVFIPMLMLIDPPYHPGITQAAFRIGDSITNLITPMMSYFALIVTFAQKYDEKNGIGTIISTMIPYSVALAIAWTLLLVLWLLTGLPLGPDGPVFIGQ